MSHEVCMHLFNHGCVFKVVCWLIFCTHGAGLCGILTCFLCVHVVICNSVFVSSYLVCVGHCFLCVCVLLPPPVSPDGGRLFVVNWRASPAGRRRLPWWKWRLIHIQTASKIDSLAWVFLSVFTKRCRKQLLSKVSHHVYTLILFFSTGASVAEMWGPNQPAIVSHIHSSNKKWTDFWWLSVHAACCQFLHWKQQDKLLFIISCWF